MTSHTTPRHSTGFIEPLEARIAPAIIFIGAKNPGFENHNDTEYVEKPFVETGFPTGERDAAFAKLNFVDINNAPVGDLIAAGLKGTGTTALLDNTVGKYFYLRLHAGDQVFAYTPGSGYGTDPLINVTGGDAIAVFTDFDNVGFDRNEYDATEFTGLVLSAAAKVQVNGGVNGDIVTGLDTHKTASTADDSLDFLHLVSSKENISNLRVLGGSVNGSVLAGGSIDNIVLNNSVANVLTGSAANGHMFDFFQSGQTDRFSTDITFAAKTAGPNITNGIFREVVGRIEAGAGGFGAKGGSLTNLTVTADTDGFALISGRGGDVDAASHVTVGGAGGTITKIIVQGTVDTSPNSAGLLTPILVQGSLQIVPGVAIVAGDGGGTHGASFATKGGAGGAITGVTIGSGGLGASSDLSADSFHAFGGKGGDGKTGGLGGSISTTNVTLAVKDATGNELEIIAGSGGIGGLANTTGGAAGAGGNLTTITADNAFSSGDPTVSTHQQIIVKAGAGGATVATSTAIGAAGGYVKTASILAYESEVDAGSGSSGNSGGKGGSVTGVTYTTSDAVVAHNMVVNAGQGGDGVKLAGGAGGLITGVKAAVADIQHLYLNTKTGAGQGGASLGGVGGAGGAISAVDVAETQVPLNLTTFLSGDVQIHAGAGGSGATGGGAGGMLSNLRVEGDHQAYNATGGQGGNATVKGRGGIGGLISLAFFKSDGQVVSGLDANGSPILANPVGVVTAGSGGTGAGAGGAGAAGGDLRSVSLSDVGTQTLKAGDGGSGQNTVGLVKGGASGKGGSITSSGVISAVGSGFLLAGNAGVNGAAAGAGGSILGSTSVNGVRALNQISIIAGNGSHGGAGGDISSVGFEGVDSALAPLGAVVVQAGNGSANGTVGGRGGNITNVTGVASGHVSSVVAPDTRDTRLTAGDGAGAGGNITHVTLSGGGADGGIIVIEAGNAGVGLTAKVGAKGGSVTDVGVAGVQDGTLVRSVAAGDGGAGTSKGGAGGSVTQVFVPNGDIGYRTGKVFGYNIQGGVFAGQGGAGASAGLNGSVNGLTAQSISSIVAGGRNSPIPHLAEKVSNVSVNGTNSQLLLSQNAIFVPDGDLVITFKGESTSLIASHSTSAEVQAALNALESIKAVGLVTVAYTSTGGYAISFNNPGDQEQLSALEIVTRDVAASIPQNQALLDIFATGGGEVALPVVEATSGLDPLTTTITVPGSTAFFATESTIGNAVTREVESITLAALGSSANPQFTLSYLGSPTTKLPANATASDVSIALNNLLTIQNVGGVSVKQSAAAGPKTFLITFNAPGRQALVGGLTYVPQVDTLDLNAINATSTQFQLTFKGASTISLNPLATDAATAAEIQSALNQLSTVQFTNPAGTGAVSVSPVGALSPGVFKITFSENGFQTALSGSANIPEVQKISVSGPAGSKFVIRSADESTPQFALNATPEQVQIALNSLPNLQSLGGVTVTQIGTDLFVKYNKVGDQASLTAAVLQPTVQTVDLSGKTATTTDYTFDSQYPVLVNEIHPGVTIPQPVTDGVSTYTELPGDSTRVAIKTQGTTTTQAVETINFGAGAGGQPALKVGDLFILSYSNGPDPTTASNSNSVVVPYQTDFTKLGASVLAALNGLPTLTGGIMSVTTTGAPANSLLITFKNNGVQQPIIIESNTPTPHPGEFVLTTPPGVAGDDVTKSVQFIDLDNVIARGGTFKLTFGGQTTAITPTSNLVLAGTISSALNGLSAISDFGGVAVTETSAGSHLFKVAFNKPNFVPDISGFGEVPESEQLDITGILADPTNEFSLTFKGEQTYILPKTATAADVAKALNLLGAKTATHPVASSITAEGGVTVYQTATGIFRVDFNKIGIATPDEPNIIVNSGGTVTHEIQHVDLRSLSGYSDGEFQLTYTFSDPLNGFTDTETTIALARDASAQEVQDALNNLSSIAETKMQLIGANVFATGAVGVTKTNTGEYDIQFNSFGQKDSLVGYGSVESDRYPITVTQTTHGAPGIVSITETKSGAASSQNTIETTMGSSSTQEHQRIDLSSFNNAGLGDFTISFGADTSSPLQFTGAGVAPSASAVEQAINGLPAIRALNGNANAVTVTGSNGIYDVAFIPNGDQVPLLISSRHAEVQQIDLGNVYSTSPTAEGEFTLAFGTQKTATLPHDATALSIQTALNNLSAVQSAGGVDVLQSTDPAHPERFSVTFRALGDEPTISATAGLTQSVQRITLGDLIGRTDTDFKLTFNGQTTNLLHANLSPVDLAAEISDALNGLNSIKDTRTAAIDPAAPTTIGHVTVAPGPVGSFTVTFDARGDVPNIGGYSVGTSDRVIPVTTKTDGTAMVAPVVTTINGTGGTKETQSIDLSKLVAGSEFQLQFDNNPNDAIVAYTTPLLTAGNTPAATADIIRNALNALPTIKATAINSTGSVNVVVNAQSTTSFDISFSGNGDQQPISGLVGHHETQSVVIDELSKFRLPVVSLDTNGLSTEGTTNTPEKQLIDLTGIKTDFSLQFGPDRTVTLLAGTDLNTIEDALNNLPSVKATGPNNTGSVTLASSTENRIEVTFAQNGDQPTITGTADSADGVFHLGVGSDSTKALQVGTLSALNLYDLQAALNGLPNIQGLRGHSQGAVTVSVVNNEYQIDFNSLGNQAPVTAIGTLAVLPTLDIHRLTDGAAGSSVTLPITEALKGSVIGPVLTTLSNGNAGQFEVQTIDLTQEQGSTGTTFNLTYGNETTATLGKTSTANDIQGALQNLPSIASHGSSAVTVAETSPGSGQFQVSFNFAGDLPQITGADSDPNSGVVIPTGTAANGTTSAQEIQGLDLSHLPANTFQAQFGTDSANISLLSDHTNASGNAALIENALNGLNSVKATVAGNNGNVSVLSNGDFSATSYGTFTITFGASADEPPIGVAGFQTTLVQDGGGAASNQEIQHIDLSSLQTVAGSSFRLSYNGGTTSAIDHLASAATVQTALNALSQFSGTNSVTVSGSNGVFDITFDDNTDHLGLILASGGDREIQHVDTSALTQAGAGQFTLQFGGQQVTFPEGASSASVQTGLNALSSINAAGRVNVTPTSDGLGHTGYDITFRTFADQPLIVGTISVFEQQILDLHQLPNDGGFLRFSANGTTSEYVPSDDGSFEKFDVQFAISQLGLGNVSVDEINTGVFQISFLSAGSQPVIEGVYNGLGVTTRVNAAATSAEFESALDNSSVSDVKLSNVDGLGHYTATFTDSNSQIPLIGVARTHEQLRIDPYATGSFTLSYKGDTTYALPVTAGADQIRVALNNLDAVKDVGGVRDVTINPDSSFTITILGDDQINLSQFVALQTLPLITKTLTNGTPTMNEFQSVEYKTLGTFDATKFANARLVGAIADFNELDSSIFHFIDLKNNPNAVYVPRSTVAGMFIDGQYVAPHLVEAHYESSPGVELLPTAADASHPFIPDVDVPVDGIVMAKIIDEKTTNFIPEARVTQDTKTKTDIFFDYVNR